MNTLLFIEDDDGIRLALRLALEDEGYTVHEADNDRLQAAKVLIAAGVDPERSLFYYQSQVPQHTELRI